MDLKIQNEKTTSNLPLYTGDRYKIKSQQACYFITMTVYKLWKDDNHAIDMGTIDMMNKIDYIHNNPVRAGIVYEPDQYIYSSAIDYAGGKGMVKVTVV